MRSTKLFFIIFILAVSGCFPAAGSSDQEQLIGTHWELIAFGSADQEVEVLDSSSITAVFEEELIKGSTGCNSYSTTYHVDGSTLKVGPMVVTEMACLEPGIMNQEAAYLSFLASVSSYDLGEGTLTLMAETGNLHFEPLKPVAPQALEGNRWRLETLELGDGETIAGQPVPEGMLVTLTFQDGQLSGSTGCNEFGAPFRRNGEQIAVEPLIKTEAQCPDETQIAFEREVFIGLEAAESLTINGNQLILTFTGGHLYFRVYEGEIVSPPAKKIVPPPAILTINNVGTRAGIGTYCWSEPQGEETAHLCVDTAGVATSPEPLQVTMTPVTATLTLPLDQMPSHLYWLTYPVTDADEQVGATAGDYRWWDFAEVEPTYLPLMAEQELVIDLPPGMYVVQVAAWWEGVGDVVYGFLLELSPSLTAEAQQAQEALISFFDLLQNGRYAEAAALYDGGYDVMAEHNPDIGTNDHAGLLQRACEVNGAICLGMKTAVFTDQPSPNEFNFQVEFANDDGSTFAIELPEQPPQFQFPFTVELVESGSFQVVTSLTYGP